MRKTVIVAAFAVLAFGLCAGIAGAQVPTSGNVYFGYTYYNTNLAPNRGGLNGWQGTLEGKLFPLLGIVADLTGQYGSLDLGEICPVVPVGGGGGGCTTFSLSTHEYNAMFGPRVGTTIGKFRPFGEFEIGVGHVSASSESNTSFAMALGGGMDFQMTRAFTLRILNVEYTRAWVRDLPGFAAPNGLQFKAGLVLRMGTW